MRLAPAALAAMVLLAGACTPRAPRAPKTHDVVFWECWPAGALEPLVAAFERENPGIRVRLHPMDRAAVRDSVAEALRSGEVPDLCQLRSEDLPPLLAAGELSDWSAGVADLRDSLRGWPIGMVGDAIYALPWVLESRALYWNKDLFARAGLDPERPPATWDEFPAAAARVQRLGGGVHGFGLPDSSGADLFDTFVALASSDSCGVLSADLDSSCVFTPRKLAAAQLLVRMRRTAWVGPAPALAREFALGRLGMLIGDGAPARALASGVAGVRWGAAAIPAPAHDTTGATLARGEALASFTSSRHKEDALRLARYLVRPENVLAVVATTHGKLPANLGADTVAFYLQRPGERAMVRMLARARYLPNHPRWAGMQDAIARALALACDGSRTAAGALAGADSAVAAFASRGGRKTP